MAEGHKDILSKTSVNASSDVQQETFYNFVRKLGRGAFGEANLYRKTEDNMLVVWKEIDLRNLSDKQRNEAQNEIEILSRFNHPSIVSYYNHFLDGTNLLIEMEYADGGNLHQKVASRSTPFLEEEILWYFYQVASAVEYIHSCFIIHRDIKTLNLFVTRTGLVKCGDFGISKVLENTKEVANTYIGTPYYMSPELIRGDPYSFKSDVWAMGCVLYELISLKKVFDATNALRLANNIVHGDFDKIDKRYSANLEQLLYEMLEKESVKRPTSTDVMKYPIIQSISEKMEAKINELNSNRNRIRETGVVPVVCSTTSDVYIWGSGRYTPKKLDIFSKKTAVQVSCGVNHFAVVTVDKELYTWCSAQKSTISGELGHKDTAAYKGPKKVESFEGIHVKQASCGEQFTVCCTDDGQVYASGSNYYGCLGLDENLDEAYEFMHITFLAHCQVSQVSCGENHVVILTDDNQVYSWGCGEFGRLGLGTEDDHFLPQKVDVRGEFRLVQCGIDCTFLVENNGRVLATGNNEHNKLGFNCTASGLIAKRPVNYDPPCKLTFFTIKPLTRFQVVSISSGRTHSAAIDAYGRLITFGSNKYGQLGVGDFKKRRGVTVVYGPLSGKRVTKVACGDRFTVIATAENQIYGCGYGESGRLGTNVEVGRGPDNECISLPRPIFGALHAVSDLTSCHWHTILVAEKVLAQKTIHASNSSIKNKYDSQISYESDLSSDYPCGSTSDALNTQEDSLRTWLRDELENADFIPFKPPDAEVEVKETNGEIEKEEVNQEEDYDTKIKRLQLKTERLENENKTLTLQLEEYKAIVQQQAEIIKSLNSKRVDFEDRLNGIWKAIEDWQEECSLLECMPVKRKLADSNEVYSPKQCAYFEEDV